MRKRRLPVIVVALMVSSLAYLCSTFVLPLPEAQAHAYVIGSDPIDGSTVSTLPSVVRIFFNAPISSISTAHVYAVESSGMVEVDASAVYISPTSSRELDIPLKTPGFLPQGSYEVRWTAVANDDGHTTYGLIGFNLGVSSTGLSGIPTLGPSTSNAVSDIQALNTISILAIAWEWLARAALALWIGILVVERFILAGSEATASLVARIKRQTHSLQWLCLGTLFVGEIVTLILRSGTLNQAFDLARMVDNGNGFNVASLPQLLVSTNYGHFWLIRIALIAAAMGLLSWMNSRRQPQPAPEAPQRVTVGITTRTGPVPRITQDHSVSTAASLTKERQAIEQNPATSSRVQRLLCIWLVLAALIVLTQALSGDAVFQPHISAMVFDWLYRIVQGAWFGGMAYLAYIVLPFLPKAELERRAETVALLLVRLVPYLLSCIGITLVCALFFAEDSLSNVQQLLNDSYGRAMFVQLILIALALLLALYALFVLRPRFTHQALSLPVVNADLPARRTRQSALEQTWHRLKQVMNMQAWLGAAILLCSSFMNFYAPPIVFPNINYNAATSGTASNASNVQTKQIGDLSLTLQVLPGKSNAINTVILLLTNSSGAPVTNAKVTLDSNMQLMDMGTT
ncbi:MAG: copper resistance protein CopC, partial [Ktedonobacteraceae bacterium]|nr:copper resistance protein CopC [Ktedonobacteraceae bacterium]